MTLNESIRDWIIHKQPDAASLAGLQIITMGETLDQDPPFLGIMETGAETVIQDGVVMHGVSTYELTCELHTVPADSDEGGTTSEQERNMRRELYDVIGDIEGAQQFCEQRNQWRIFDIRATAPTTEPKDDRRMSVFGLQIIACPI
jgi:hypothetical protein